MEVGRIRACCDLVAQYLPTEIRDALVSSYEYVPNLNITAAHELNSAQLCSPPKARRSYYGRGCFEGCGRSCSKEEQGRTGEGERERKWC